MKSKKMLVPLIILILTAIAFAAAITIFFNVTEPEILRAEFPYSITYEYNGETKTAQSTVICEFSHSRSDVDGDRRYWFATRADDEEHTSSHVIEENDDMIILLHTNIEAGYLMGDPLYKDHSDDEPYAEYYNFHDNENIYDSEDKHAFYEKTGFRIIDFCYPEPIENSFSTVGIFFTGDSVVPLMAISLIALILCLIFVRKEKDLTYSTLDKAGLILNFIVIFLFMPFVTIASMLTDINGDGSGFTCQLSYITPAIALLCIAASVVFRRKGYSGIGFFIQLAGPAILFINIQIDTIIHMF